MIVHTTSIGSRGVHVSAIVIQVVFASAPLSSLEAQADLAIVGIHAKDLHIHILADLDHFLRALDLLVGKLRDVQQALKIILEFNEDTEVGDLGDLAFDDHAGAIRGWDGFDPRILMQLLEAEADALLLLVDFHDHALHVFALLEDLVGVRDLLGPGNIADVQKPIDSWFDLDERTVVGEVADLAFDDGSWRVFLRHEFPGVDLGLLHAQRDLQLVLVDIEDDDIDLVVNRDAFAGMVDATGPGHLADVHEAFDAFFQTDKGAVGHEVHDLALHAAADRELVLDLLPGGGFLLLEAQGDLFLVAIDVEDLDLDLLANPNDFAGMVDPAPGHVRDVEKAIDATKIDERTEFGDVRHAALHEVAFGDGSEQVLLGFLALDFDELAARDDDVATFLVDLEDDSTNGLADEFADITWDDGCPLVKREGTLERRYRRAVRP